MQPSKLIAPAVGIIVSFSANIAFEGIAKQILPTDLKALPSFGIKLGSAIVGAFIAERITKLVTENVSSVVETLLPEESETDPPAKEEN